jgi:hypothetical protein
VDKPVSTRRTALTALTARALEEDNGKGSAALLGLPAKESVRATRLASVAARMEKRCVVNA